MIATKRSLIDRHLKVTPLNFTSINLYIQTLHRHTKRKENKIAANNKRQYLQEITNIIPDIPPKAAVAKSRISIGRNCLAKGLHRIGILHSREEVEYCIVLY